MFLDPPEIVGVSSQMLVGSPSNRVQVKLHKIGSDLGLWDSRQLKFSNTCVVPGGKMSKSTPGTSTAPQLKTQKEGSDYRNVCSVWTDVSLYVPDAHCLIVLLIFCCFVFCERLAQIFWLSKLMSVCVYFLRFASEYWLVLI